MATAEARPKGPASRPAAPLFPVAVAAIPDENLAAAARSLARFAVAEALKELGLDPSAKGWDDVGNNQIRGPVSVGSTDEAGGAV
jgi:hypothetical protein